MQYNCNYTSKYYAQREKYKNDCNYYDRYNLEDIKMCKNNNYYNSNEYCKPIPKPMTHREETHSASEGESKHIDNTYYFDNYHNKYNHYYITDYEYITDYYHEYNIYHYDKKVIRECKHTGCTDIQENCHGHSQMNDYNQYQEIHGNKNCSCERKSCRCSHK